MTTEEIEKAAEEYAKRLDYSMEAKHNMCAEDFAIAFRKGAEFTDKHWQEKTRWKSLETEPPTNYTYGKMYLLRTESGSPYLIPLRYKESAKEFISCGFVEWKEIE